MSEERRALRPFYLMIDRPGSEAERQALLERDRALALEAVISHAPDMGIDKALKKFGDSLLPTEHKLLQTLTKEELVVLKSVKSKLGNLLGGKGISINLYHK